MTTKQLAARIRKYYKTYGSISLKGMIIPCMTNGTGAPYILDRLCEDDNEIGVMCVGDEWFVSLNELTYSELSKIVKLFNVK